MLEGLPSGVEVVYLVGKSPASWLTWALRNLPPGWEPGTHYLEATAPVLRYVGPGGRKIEMHRAAQWFGGGPYTCEEAETAWGLLRVAVAAAFKGATVLATPATTGRELFLRTIPYGREFPVLSADLQALIRSTDGQGRTEVVTPRRTDELAGLPALYEYDGRLMYAALCWGLPMGIPLHDAGSEYMGQQRGRYRVKVTVPRSWGETFGLVGLKRDDGSRLWEYPAEPGRTFATWCDGAEVHVMLRCGWEVRILERLLWPNVAGRGPLDTWAAKLVQCRDGLAGSRFADPGDNAAQLAANGVRAILLHGIGAFHGRPHAVTRYRPAADPGEIPEGARNVRLEGDYVVYTIETAHPAEGSWRAQMSHPEWCAAIWARARARLLEGPGPTGALHRTAGEVVGFRTDAIYLTARQNWADDAKAGRLRLKRSCELGPYPWPVNGTELVALRERGVLA